jgi:hypothetical protein
VNRYAAGAGASTGTIIAALANNLSSDNALKSWLVIVAPAVAVGLSYMLAVAGGFFQDWIGQWRARRALADAVKFFDEIINDPESSEDEKDSARKEKAALRRVFAKASGARFRARIKDDDPGA